MANATKTIFAIIGILILVAIIYNWRRIFPISQSNLNDVGKRVSRLLDDDDDDDDAVIINNDKSICKVTRNDGTIVEIKGDSNDPQFQSLCRYANSRNYNTPYNYYGNYYYPYYYYWVVNPRPRTGTGTGTGAGTGTGTGTGV